MCAQHLVVGVLRVLLWRSLDLYEGLSCRQFRSPQRETFCGVVVGRDVLEGRWAPRTKREKMASAAESSRKVS